MEMPKRELEQGYDELMGRIGDVFSSESGFRMARNYIRGLISPIERKNGWQMAEALGAETPYAVQQFLYRGRFSADGLRDELRCYVSEKLGEPDGILVTDETGFLKKGEKSCGVQRQYSGTAGRVENCQIGVFLTYASSRGHAPIDRGLYLPKGWCEDQERRDGAGVPEDATFQTKPQMALEMIRAATQAGVPYRWVTGDCVYGDSWAMQQWLEEQDKCYVLCVSGKEYLRHDIQQARVNELIKGLPEEGWFEASCGDGSKGARVYDWMWFDLTSSISGGWKHSMLVRRSKSDPGDLQAYLCYAPENTSVEKLVQIAGSRWTVECCFEESKSEVGMDHYEVRSYDGWYKHITFACLALALLTVLSAYSLDTKTMQEHDPGLNSLEAFKRGRGLRV